MKRPGHERQYDRHPAGDWSFYILNANGILTNIYSALPNGQISGLG